MRRRNVKNADQRIKDASLNVITEGKEHKGSWSKLFGNNNPIHLEIGMGKGDFIIEHARTNPNVNYIGLEKFPSVLIQAADKLNDTHLDNLYLLLVDAATLDEIFEKHEIDKIYLNFSDPWPKARHAKRRLTSSNFLKNYEHILKQDGLIEFKTDNRPLFEYSIVSMNNYGMEFLDLSFDLHNRNVDEYIIKTEYEKKFMAKGNPIYFIQTKFKK